MRVNVYLHVLGTILSILYLILCVNVLSPWYLLLYPIVHATPGLIGHKLYEPSNDPSVGDTRVFRTDFPGYYFLAGNHVLTWQVLTGQHKI